MMHIFHLLPTLLLSLLLTACGSDIELRPLGPDSVILAFGDSLTYGTGAGDDESYPAILEQLVDRTVINEGIPGEVSAAGMARLSSLLTQHQPSLLILCHGGNDILRRKNRAMTANNLRTMINMARSRNIDVVMLGVPDFGLPRFLSAAGFYEEVADEMRVPYEGDVLPEVIGKEALKADSVHPNAAGYRLIAEHVAELLKKHGAL